MGTLQSTTYHAHCILCNTFIIISKLKFHKQRISMTYSLPMLLKGCVKE